MIFNLNTLILNIVFNILTMLCTPINSPLVMTDLGMCPHPQIVVPFLQCLAIPTRRTIGKGLKCIFL